ASAFSFNSAQGQCERCRGAGFEKIEMQFLSDVYVRCPECNGRRYRPHILEVILSSPDHPVDPQLDKEPLEAAPLQSTRRQAKSKGRARAQIASSARTWSIADMLNASVDEAIEFLGS